MRTSTCKPGVWLKIAKKGSGIPSLTADEAVDVGLCYGWISGQRKPCDEVYYLQKYVPRRPRSRWSQVNVAKVERAERGRADASVRPGRGRGREGRGQVGHQREGAKHRQGTRIEDKVAQFWPLFDSITLLTAIGAATVASA